MRVRVTWDSDEPHPNCWCMSPYYWSPSVVVATLKADIVTHVTSLSLRPPHVIPLLSSQSGARQETQAPDVRLKDVLAGDFLLLWCAELEDVGLTEWRTDQRLVLALLDRVGPPSSRLAGAALCCCPHYQIFFHLPLTATKIWKYLV